MHNGAPRVLMLLPGAFGPAGGLEMYDRLLLKATAQHCDELGGRVEALILNDRPEDLAPSYYEGRNARVVGCSRRKSAMIAQALACMAVLDPHLVIVGHVNMAPLALALAAARPAAKQWFVVYGIDAWRHLGWPGRFALQRCQRILSISDFTSRELCRYNDVDLSKVQLLPCALDPFHQAQALRLQAGVAENAESGPVVLTVARLTRGDTYKGIDHTLEAFAVTSQNVPNARYDIVGTGDDRPRLEALARSLGIAERVRFHGRVDDVELARAYARCTVFVMPSRKEGFGIVFLEAALYGKPSIGGDHGGSPEVIEDGKAGYLVRHGDIKTLAERMTQLVSDPALAQRMGHEARMRLERDFSYPALEKRLRGYLSESLRSEP